MSFIWFLRIATIVLAASAVLISWENRLPESVPCAPADATPISVPVRYQDVKVPDLDKQVVIAMLNHENIWVRDYFGCMEHETDPKKCVWEAGGTNGPEYLAAREQAKLVYGLAESKKARFQ